MWGMGALPAHLRRQGHNYTPLKLIILLRYSQLRGSQATKIVTVTFFQGQLHLTKAYWIIAYDVMTSTHQNGINLHLAALTS